MFSTLYLNSEVITLEICSSRTKIVVEGIMKNSYLQFEKTIKSANKISHKWQKQRWGKSWVHYGDETNCIDYSLGSSQQTRISNIILISWIIY